MILQESELRKIVKETIVKTLNDNELGSELLYLEMQIQELKGKLKVLKRTYAQKWNEFNKQQ